MDRVEVYQSALHADGVRAKVAIHAGEVLFEEKPLYFLQSLDNRPNVLVCACCHEFIGSQDVTLSLLERTIDRQTIAASCGACSDQTGGSLEIVSCDQCCGELYCSNECKLKHWCSGHYLLCTGNVSEAEAASHPLIQFKSHAITTNEIFLLVADVFASIIASVEGLSGGEPRSVDEILSQTSSYVRGLWWDVALEPEKASKKALPAAKVAAKRKKFQETLKSLVRDSWSLLSAALHLPERNLDRILSMEYMARTIGMFEQNNVGVIAQCPLARQSHTSSEYDSRFLEAARKIVAGLEAGDEEDWSDADDDDESNEGDDCTESDGCCSDGDCDEDCKVSSVADAVTATTEGEDPSVELAKIIEENGLERIFPPLDGTAFYTMICKINHSCEPNVIVRYDPPTAASVFAFTNPEKGLRGYLYAIRDINAGDELVQSYIDQDLSYAKRQAALKDYGFECNCSKCVREKASYATA